MTKVKHYCDNINCNHNDTSSRMTKEQKTCLKCKNQNCFIVYGVPQEKKKDCKEHHENFDWDKVFDCKNHNRYKDKV